MSQDQKSASYPDFQQEANELTGCKDRLLTAIQKNQQQLSHLAQTLGLQVDTLVEMITSGDISKLLSDNKLSPVSPQLPKVLIATLGSAIQRLGRLFSEQQEEVNNILQQLSNSSWLLNEQAATQASTQSGLHTVQQELHSKNSPLQEQGQQSINTTTHTAEDSGRNSAFSKEKYYLNRAAERFVDPFDYPPFLRLPEE